MESINDRLLEAFPRALRADVSSVVANLPVTSRSPAQSDVGPVRISREPVRIPARIYNAEPSAELRASMSRRQQVILDWLYTRHHDGYVREAALRRAMPVRELWMAPFVIQLMGEYVVEILMVIDELLDEDQVAVMREFASDNVEFLALTRAHVASYWNCYYRFKVPRLADYVGTRLLNRVESKSTHVTSA